MPIIDLNNALVSHILTGSHCFVTAAGYVGPKFRMDHDISLLVPEVWARMEVHERAPQYLKDNNFLEQLEDFEYQGKMVPASRLGWRITDHFVRTFFGIVFDNPNDLFSAEMLRPELQSMEAFVDGIDNIVSAQQKVAENYFRDGGIDLACPPLRALLHIMRDGHFEGSDINAPAVRDLFTREHLMASDWYAARLRAQQTLDTRAWARHIAYLETLLHEAAPLDEAQRRPLGSRLQRAHAELKKAESEDYVASLHGFLGADPAVLCLSCS